MYNCRYIILYFWYILHAMKCTITIETGTVMVTMILNVVLTDLSDVFRRQLKVFCWTFNWRILYIFYIYLCK